MRTLQRSRRVRAVACVIGVLVLGGCGGSSGTERVVADARVGLPRVHQPTRTTAPMTTTTFSPVKGAQAARAAIDLAVVWGYAAAAQYAAGVRTSLDRVRVSRESNTARLSAPAATPSATIAQVMACIYRAESGDPTEHSHPSSGSGAAQWIPSTWRAWSARAGYPGYSYAYLAPASVQESVLIYTLTHGGAHNWDPAYGADSCTVGMP